MYQVKKREMVFMDFNGYSREIGANKNTEFSFQNNFLC